MVVQCMVSALDDLRRGRISPVLVLRERTVDSCKAYFAENGPSPSQELQRRRYRCKPHPTGL